MGGVDEKSWAASMTENIRVLLLDYVGGRGRFDAFADRLGDLVDRAGESLILRKGTIVREGACRRWARVTIHTLDGRVTLIVDRAHLRPLTPDEAAQYKLYRAVRSAARAKHRRQRRVRRRARGRR